MRHHFVGVLIGLLAALLVLGADRVLTSFFGDQNPLYSIELKAYDWRMKRAVKPETARPDIALILIDETTVRRMQPIAGRWPWPRVVHSTLLDYLARAHAKVIVYDVNFAEADGQKGINYGAEWSGEESDRELAKSAQAAGNVIMLADATYEGTLPNTPALPDAGYALDVPGIYDAPTIFPPFPVLAGAVSGFGHNLFVVDSDGVLRHVVPFVRSGGRALPSLGVAAALRVAGIKPSDVRLEGDELHLGDAVMPLDARRVNSSDGVRSYLWGLLNFRGPALLDDLQSRTYPTYSAVDLLESEQQINNDQPPTLDPATFRDKIVFVGASAAGTYDAFETPFANGIMPGINVHAAATDDILSRRFMRPVSGGRKTAIVLFAGVTIGILATLLPVWWATAVNIAIIALFGVMAARVFADGYWLNVTQPFVASSLALFSGVGYQYFVEGREKRKMKKLFGQYVSKDVYHQLVSDPTRARLGGARREMTVLFSDIRGFTSVSEKGQPEDIVHTLNEYFTKMVDIVFKHQGTLDKFVGDMVMALFNAPLDDPQHADHAVEAALDMIDELMRLNEGWTVQNRPNLDIGIGINTGPMIAGNIGSEQIMSYTVIGDAVNLGSRLESLNKNYGTRIIISEATRSLLTGRYEFRALGDVVVKGKTQPVAIFEVVRRVSAPGEQAVSDSKEARV